MKKLGSTYWIASLMNPGNIINIGSLVKHLPCSFNIYSDKRNKKTKTNREGQRQKDKIRKTQTAMEQAEKIRKK